MKNGVCVVLMYIPLIVSEAGLFSYVKNACEVRVYFLFCELFLCFAHLFVVVVASFLIHFQWIFM